MKVTHRWLGEFASLAGVSALELGNRLTLAGLEVESVTAVAGPFSGVVVGEVLAAGRHPNAEKLSLCEVTTGTDRLQIVCGASNVRAGLKVAVASPDLTCRHPAARVAASAERRGGRQVAVQSTT